eukprot:Skav207961  [mRNA]  locus=scaffold108:587833:588144:+ [translate_table: standard]
MTMAMAFIRLSYGFHMASMRFMRLPWPRNSQKALDPRGRRGICEESPQAALTTLLRAAGEAELDIEDARYKLCRAAGAGAAVATANCRRILVIYQLPVMLVML